MTLFDDGKCNHFPFHPVLKTLGLACTNSGKLHPVRLGGLAIIFVHPYIEFPGETIPESWRAILGAEDSAPQALSFNKHLSTLYSLGVHNVFGLSTQPTCSQIEIRKWLGLHYELLSDEDRNFLKLMRMPEFQWEDQRFLKRVTLAVYRGKIVRWWYPIQGDELEENVMEVLLWLYQKGKTEQPFWYGGTVVDVGMGVDEGFVPEQPDKGDEEMSDETLVEDAKAVQVGEGKWIQVVGLGEGELGESVGKEKGNAVEKGRGKAVEKGKGEVVEKRKSKTIAIGKGKAVEDAKSRVTEGDRNKTIKKRRGRANEKAKGKAIKKEMGKEVVHPGDGRWIDVVWPGKAKEVEGVQAMAGVEEEKGENKENEYMQAMEEIEGGNEKEVEGAQAMEDFGGEKEKAEALRGRKRKSNIEWGEMI